TIASQFTSQAGMIFAPLITAVVIGLYYGLRTGVFECGIPYLATRYSRMRTHRTTMDIQKHPTRHPFLL
ncbi:MAG TPA: hypothetical protein VK436_05225, partial [Methanocella sp.]|nr:hypothetical protein [Methanocella sp.]